MALGQWSPGTFPWFGVALCYDGQPPPDPKPGICSFQLMTLEALLACSLFPLEKYTPVGLDRVDQVPGGRGRIVVT